MSDDGRIPELEATVADLKAKMERGSILIRDKDNCVRQLGNLLAWLEWAEDFRHCPYCDGHVSAGHQPGCLIAGMSEWIRLVRRPAPPEGEGSP